MQNVHMSVFCFRCERVPGQCRILVLRENSDVFGVNNLMAIPLLRSCPHFHGSGTCFGSGCSYPYLLLKALFLIRYCYDLTKVIQTL